jgi:hypothetical protein
VQRSIRFAERVCIEALREPRRLSFALEALALHDSPDVRRRFLESPNASFQVFEAACSRGDFAGLIGDGLARLVHENVGIVSEGFVRCPKVLARTTRLLGTVRQHALRALFERFRAHPLSSVDLSGVEPGALVQLLTAHCPAGISSPLPRAVKMAIVGGAPISEVKWGRARERVVQQFPRLQLQILAQMSLETLAGNLKADLGDERVRHALQMLSLLDENRRPLRRLLTRYFSGDRRFIREHPRSMDWLRRHPKIRAPVWREGLKLSRELSSGRVTLALEQDPLEALRLGTHVGSCLGLNGVCAYSAAAAVLDVNKRVLYARDVHGSVVARQLLAISADDQLVPFSVYPESAASELKEAFLEYDLAFARALGLALSEQDVWPEVEDILSSAFWHDGVWELFAPLT